MNAFDVTEKQADGSRRPRSHVITALSGSVTLDTPAVITSSSERANAGPPPVFRK